MTLDFDAKNSSLSNEDSLAEKKLARNYDKAAWFYETTAGIYSTGQIYRSKVNQLQTMETGQSILYLGVGAGEDAICAAKKGLTVTCLDISQKMLERVKRKIKAKGYTATFHCLNAFDFVEYEKYDAVATNFFLNCFHRPKMQQMMNHAIKLIKPGGKLMVADVSPPVGSLPSKCFNLMYSKWAMSLFWMLQLVPWHENYDYKQEMIHQGLSIERTDDYRIAKFGPVMFRSVTGCKNT